MAPPIVLVIGDEEKNIKLLKAMLSREALYVIVASNGEAALQEDGDGTYRAHKIVAADQTPLMMNLQPRTDRYMRKASSSRN